VDFEKDIETPALGRKTVAVTSQALKGKSADLQVRRSLGKAVRFTAETMLTTRLQC
jgi:hypothetical protein